MKKVLKYSLRSVIFFAILGGLLLLFSYLFVPKNNYADFGMDMVKANGILGERENSIDVLIVGDSEAYSSITPMKMWDEYGFTSYVCSSGSQPLYESLRFVETTFERQSPKLVIVEADNIFVKVPVKAVISSRLQTVFSVFRYHNRWKSLTRSDFGGAISYTWTDDFKGYTYFLGTDSAPTEGYMKPDKGQQSIDVLNLGCLKRIQELCDEHGAQLLFLSIPSTKNWNYQKHNGMQEYADENGYPYVDMNLLRDEIPIDWEADTRDKGDHLNYTGAVKVTDYLGAYLAQSYAFEDHRGDPAYAAWNEALQRYFSTIASAD